MMTFEEKVTWFLIALIVVVAILVLRDGGALDLLVAKVAYESGALRLLFGG